MARIAVADRREALLAAAVRTIAARGVARASVRDIAAAAEMPPASFHYVFDSRDAMLGQLAGALVAGQREQVVASLAAADDLPALVGAALEGWLDRAVAEPDAEVVLHELIAWSRWTPGRGELAAAVYEHYESAVLSVVAVAHERFGTRWSVPERDVARLALVLTDGTAARWLVDRDEGSARAALRRGAAALLALVAEAGR